MSAKDKIHTPVKNALIKAGYTVTHDPYTLWYGSERVYIDMAAEWTSPPEHIIIIEVKSFVKASIIRDFEDVLGQYIFYFGILKLTQPKYKLYIAISDKTYSDIIQREMINITLQFHAIPLIIVDIDQEEIVKWIN
ncbi:MAG: XisH protein [Anaerolineaceae bacterium 4572_78]|nr:MAG: XisH protein [Anaerolineaceae bacterium 4572_78]